MVVSTASVVIVAACGRTPVGLSSEDIGVAHGPTTSNADEGTEPPSREWLVTIDTNGYELLRIDAADGSTEVICALEPDGSRYTSTAFDRAGRLFATYKVDASDTAPDELARLDPCTCEKDVIAEYGFGGAAGLAWSDDTLFALAHAQDLLLSLDPHSGEASTIGPVGVDIRNHGASWSAADGLILVLEGSADVLFGIDAATGDAEVVAELQFDFSTVGFEVHPRSGRMYACTGDAVLYEIDAVSGAVTAVGPLEHPGNCGNLAAARGPVDCVGA